MGRLLEGDVGSGKTFVAAVIAYAVLHTRATPSGSRLQVAYMAPTEILAKQHFESFIEFFKGTDVEIGLLTGSGCKKFPSKTSDDVTTISRAQLIKWLKEGRVSIVIGTHALIQKSVEFANLALIIIDEQHRFGVKQRASLARKHPLTKRGLNADETQTKQKESKLIHEEITYKIREALFEVKKELGLGHKELIYQRALEIEMKMADISFQREFEMPIFYRDEQIGTRRVDFLVDGLISVELKAITKLEDVHFAQAINYLEAYNLEIGLLINFGETSLTFKRLTNKKYKSTESQKSNNS